MGGIFMLPVSSYAQFTKGLNYRTETGISFSGGEHTPFWLTANKQGLSSIEKNSGYLRAGIFREMEDDKRFSYAFGADLAVAYNFTSSTIVRRPQIPLPATEYRKQGTAQ